MPGGTDLARALDRAYDVFASSPPPRHLDACDCCHGDGDLKALLATAPRDLSTRRTEHLLSTLGLTLGGARETRWFAPRLAASLVDDADRGAFDLLGGVLVRAGWPAWPGDEVAALRAVFAAIVDHALRHETDSSLLSRKLVAIGRCETDFAPYLAVWDALPVRERSLALLRLCGWDGDVFSAAGLPAKSAWSEAPEAFAAVRAFVRDPARLLAAADHLEDPALAGSRDAMRTWIGLLSA